MNWGIISTILLLPGLWSLLIFVAYLQWSNLKKERKKDKNEIILMKILFGFFVFFVIICPFLFGKVIYDERFRIARGSLSWGRYTLPNNGDCDASCKVQCDKDDYNYIINSDATSCDCVCAVFCKQCVFCKNTPDEDIRAWIGGMER